MFRRMSGVRGKFQYAGLSSKDDRDGMEERRRRRGAENEREERDWVLVKCGVSCVRWR